MVPVLKTLPACVLSLLLFASCQTTPKDAAADVPYTIETFAPDYAAYVLEVADADKDGTVTLVEWTNAGGDQRSFLLVDENKDGAVTRTELVRLGSNVKFFDFTRRNSDFNKDSRLSRREFRTSSGVSVLRFTF